MFYNNLKAACKQKGIGVSAIITNLNLSMANLSNWKAGRVPKTDILMRIANILDVSTDYLLTGKEKAATQKDDGLSAEFTALYSRLDESHQAAVLSLIKSLLDNQ